MVRSVKVFTIFVLHFLNHSFNSSATSNPSAFHLFSQQGLVGAVDVLHEMKHCHTAPP